MIDKLLLEHVGLPHVLVLAVHLGNFFSWLSQGGHSEQLLFFALFYQSTPSCLKVRGGNEQFGMLVAHVILVSAQGQNPSFFLFWGTFIQLGACWDQDLDQGLTIMTAMIMMILPEAGPAPLVRLGHVDQGRQQTEAEVTQQQPHDAPGDQCL